MSELLLLGIAVGAGTLLVLLGVVDIASWKERTSWAFGRKDSNTKARGLSKLMGGIFGIVGFVLVSVILGVVFATP